MEKGLMAKRLLKYRMALQRTPTTNHSSNEHAPDLLRIPWKLTLLYRANWITENCKREKQEKTQQALAPIKNAISNVEMKVAPSLAKRAKTFSFQATGTGAPLGSHPLEARTSNHSTPCGKVSWVNPLKPSPLPADPANPWRWCPPGNGK